MDARRIGIVGPCSSGKSTLARALRALGYRVKEIMQEHCAAPMMWRRISNPDVLIYLDVTMGVAARREGLEQPSAWWVEEREVRLAHARAHCDLYIDTSALTPEDILTQVLGYLKESTENLEVDGMVGESPAAPILSFVGRSNSGKTTLLEKLIALLRERGYRVGVVKHTVRADVETDLPGTDTRRLWEAGAQHVAFVTPDRIVHTRRYAELPPLEAALAGVGDVDLVLIEGFKYGPYPKIEVVRAARDPALIPDLENRIACVTDVPDLACGVPKFAFDDGMALVDFVERVVIRCEA